MITSALVYLQEGVSGSSAPQKFESFIRVQQQKRDCLGSDRRKWWVVAMSCGQVGWKQGCFMKSFFF